MSSRLYASMLANRRNTWSHDELNDFLSDWRRRCQATTTERDQAAVLTAAAGAAARAGLVKVAVELLEQVPQSTFVPPGALRVVLGSCRRVQCDASARTVLRLIQQRCDLTIIDYTNGVLACLGDPLDLVQEALESGLALDNWATTVFLLACSDNGDETLTDRVWETAQSQRLVVEEKTLGAYLSALGDFGLGERALAVSLHHADLMNDISTVSLLTALSHSGMPDQALKVFDSLRDPTMQHVNCVVDALARAGRLDEAHTLLLRETDHSRATPVETDGVGDGEEQRQLAVGWMTLLGGAVKHANVHLAEAAASELRQITHDPGQFAAVLTLLGNAHRAAGDETKATEAHAERLARRLRKEPGQSTVVVGKQRCTFVANGLASFSVDGTDQPLDKAMRRRILARLDQWGNVCQHSEKLALAYALECGVQTPVLYKNLRMCADCHESTLLITVQEGIVVRHRDQNRWHIMKNGVCSCGNYW